MTDPVPLNEARERILPLMTAGNRAAAIREAGRTLAAGVGLADFVLGVLAPAQAQIGRLWQSGALSTQQEHLATEIAEFLLTMAAGRQTPAGDGAHLVLCVADRDHHNLPARMVAELLRLEGHRVTFIGPARPGPSLDNVLARLRPDAVVLSCSLAMNLPQLHPIAAACREHGLPVIGGGRGFNDRPERAARLGITKYAATIVDVTLDPATLTEPAAADPARHGQYQELAAAHRPLSDELTERYLWQAGHLLSRPLRDPANLRGYIENLLRFVEGAVLCDEQILTDYLPWLVERFTALRADPAAVPLLLATTRERLAPDLPHAGVALEAAIAG